MESNEFSFAGRILSNRGLPKYGKKVTYSNCYVVDPPQDNLESIFNANYEIARIFSYGGGAGVDLSQLRPKGSIVNNAAKTTTGPISFLQIYNQTSQVIGQDGRRAALMVSMLCEHPDIEDFIYAKSESDSLKMMNMSIRYTDRFLESAQKNKDFMLNFHVKDTRETITKMANAKDLLYAFSYNNWEQAEPGALYWNRIESWHLLSKDPGFKLEGVNPCAEEPLPANGSCLLAAINLSELVNMPFTDESSFNFARLEYLVQKGVEALNTVLDEGLPLHPLQKIKDVVRDYRQIGLGIMGYADMLIKMGLRYGSKEALALTDLIGSSMINNALIKSALLARDLGTYPKYYEQAILSSDFLKANAWVETIELIKKYGLRNSQLLTIAPTGSTAPLLGASWATEPIYDISYRVKTEQLMGVDTYYEVFTPIVAELMEFQHIEKLEDLPDYIVTAKNIEWVDRIDTQAILQTHIDASISSTVNLPNSVTPEDIMDIYLYAWRTGCKGITVYRDGCKRDGVLVSTEAEKCSECGAEMNIVEGCKVCPSCGHGGCSL